MSDAKKDAKSGKDIGESWYITQTIKNGTPLPKGHGRLKDIDKVEQLLDLDNPDNAFCHCGADMRKGGDLDEKTS